MERQAPTSPSSLSPSTSSPQMSSSSKPALDLPPATKNCAHCSTAVPTPTPSTDEEEAVSEKGLKPCSKCHTALYCSRDCAKAAWKTHKKICAADAQKYALSVKEKPAAAPRVPKEGHRGGLQKWQFDT